VPTKFEKFTITEKKYPGLGEKYLKIAFDNGFTCAVIPKDFAVAYACFAVDFGSADRHYTDKNNADVTFPAGLAHFLEHRMYFTPKGDATNLYAALGGDSNAYTAPDKTCFLFSAADNIYENLGVLLEHISKASFTANATEKEKKIITQEINMFRDNKRWLCRKNMLACLYGGDSPIAEDPAGNTESIQSFTRGTLANCKKNIYNLQNSLLCVCGRVEVEKVIQTIKQNLFLPKSSPLSRLDLTPKGGVVSGYCEVFSPTPTPYFSIGINLSPFPAEDGEKLFAEVEIALQLLFGKSSAFYSECYRRKLFEEFDTGCQTVRNYFFADLSGMSSFPGELYEEVKRHIAETTKKGFKKADFERVKKSLYGGVVCGFDDAEDIADNFISHYFESGDSFEYVEVIKNITKAQAEDCLRLYFSPENTCLSVIKTKEDKT